MSVLGGFCFILVSAFCVHRVLRFQQYEVLVLRPRSMFVVTDIVRIVFGVLLLISSLDERLFAPHLIPDEFQRQVLMLQSLAAILLISGKAVLFACMILGSLFVYLFVTKGAIVFFEYFNLVGIVAFIVLMRFTASVNQKKHGVDDEEAFNRFQAAVTLLRMCLGIALITLGFSEKILNPDMAMAFMEKYESLNFMIYFFEGFDHRTFILCNGAAEILFGLIYVLGLVPRLNTIALVSFLVASNVYFYFLNEYDLAMMELMGHGPLIATAIILLVAGESKSYKSTLVYLLKAIRPNYDESTLDTDDMVASFRRPK